MYEYHVILWLDFNHPSFTNYAPPSQPAISPMVDVWVFSDPTPPLLQIQTQPRPFYRSNSNLVPHGLRASVSVVVYSRLVTASLYWWDILRLHTEYLTNNFQSRLKLFSIENELMRFIAMSFSGGKNISQLSQNFFNFTIGRRGGVQFPKKKYKYCGTPFWGSTLVKKPTLVNIFFHPYQTGSSRR